MTLEKLLWKISEMAIQQKIINFGAAGPDIYGLNGLTIKAWPVLFTSPTGSHTVHENSIEYNISIFYLDRLLTDSENEIGIMSTAIEELKNIIRNIAQFPEVIRVSEDYDITNFVETEAFNDRVAGAYATLNIEVLNDTLCAE